MTIQYSVTHQSNNMADLVTQAGATANLLIFSGAPPAHCSIAPTGTLLATLPCSATLGSVAAGVLTFNAITAEAAGANGTAGYWRLCTSSAGTTVVAQGTVGVTGADLNFNGGVTFTAGETISVSSFTITANGA
jgi:hypothetical protein